MNVQEKFLELTKKTYPHGHEHELLNILPSYLNMDEFGNLFYKIGENPTTMFTCHLDTASYDQVNVNHVMQGDFILTDGRSILGADDKAGVVVLLYLMEHNVPGIYYFFLGEERGCIGSKQVASIQSKNKIENINKVVSFDRRGYDSVITHQVSGRSCSNEFAKELSNQLNEKSMGIVDGGFKYSPDPTGIYTDSAQFIDIYSECTNISVGYHNEHTKSESQNIKHLEELCKVVVKIDWERLSTHRNPKKYVYDEDDFLDYGYGVGYGYSSTYKYQDEPIGSNSTTTEVILDEDFYGHESSIEYDTFTKEIIKVKLHAGRILYEKNRIDELLSGLEVPYDNIHWDGNNLTIEQDSYQNIYLNRNEIKEYIQDIDKWIEEEISDKKKNYI
jgi:hypothetical protein